MQQPPQPPYGPQGQPYPPYGTQYGSPQMQPAPQPRKKSRKKPIIFGCLGLIVLFLVIIVVAAIATGGGPSQATTGGTTPTAQTQATTAPTSAPTAIPTHAPTPTLAPTQAPTQAPASSGLPATHGAPRLGGPLSDFIGAYGQPNGNSNPPSFEFQEVNNINEVGAMSIGASCQSPQCIGQQQIDDVTVQSPDQTNGYAVSEAEAKCMAYAPTDAHFKQKIPYSDGTGYDMVYSSATLAKEFPASEFTDGNSNQVAAGTFDVSYLYADNKTGIGSCDMITGEQQTNG